MDAFLVSDLVEDDSRLVVLVFIKAILFNLFNGQRSKKWIFFDDLPGVQSELGIDCPLGRIENIKAEVIGLNRESSTSTIGK